MKKCTVVFIIFILLLGCSLLFGCSACSNQNQTMVKNDNDLELSYEKIQLINHTAEYDLEYDYISTYFYPNGNVPLIDINSFVASLNGYIDTEKIRYTVNENDNYLTQKWISNNYTYQLKVYWDTNQIWVNNFGYFNITKSIKGTNYSAHNKWIDVTSSNEKSITFNIGSYYFDILYYNQKVLVPLPILNILFCSTNQTNVLYDGEEYHFYYGTPSKELALSMRESKLNNTECPEDVRKASINGLIFTMNYFYGLNEYKGIDFDFKNYMSEKQLADLWSSDYIVYNHAYIEIIQQGLDELHTNLIYPSIYNKLEDNCDIYNEENIGSNWKGYYDSLDELNSNYQNTFEDRHPVRFKGRTAFIKFDSFNVAPNNILYNESGILKNDAWRYDTFYFMLNAMNLIKQQHNIQSIVIDLTTNGGGTLGAMYSALGFLTNKNIKLPSYNTLTNEFRLDYYAIDSDDDGNYNDEDAYTQYNWYILTSKNTFSAANYFVSVAKNMNIATIIGEPTGGGMCSVMPCVLADGTTFRISSNNSLRYHYYNDKTNKNIYQEIESGISPDYKIDREKFYDLSYLDEFISFIETT